MHAACRTRGLGIGVAAKGSVIMQMSSPRRRSAANLPGLRVDRHHDGSVGSRLGTKASLPASPSLDQILRRRRLLQGPSLNSGKMYC